MSESEVVASQQKQQSQQQQQQQHFNQQFNPNPMANMVWQYPQPANMHQYQGFPNQMYPQGYNPQGQMYYYPPGMMTAYGSAFNGQQIPPQQQQQQQQQPQQQQSVQNNQSNKSQVQQQQQQQSQQPIQPMVLDDDADLPPLPPGPPPPTQPPPQHNNQPQTPLQNQQQMFMYYQANYGGWTDQNDMSQFNNGQQPIRFNSPNKKAGLGSVPSGNSGAAKKKRRKNKYVTASQMNNNSFQGNNVVTTFTPGTDIKPDSLPPLPPSEVIAPLPKSAPPAIKTPDVPVVPAPIVSSSSPTNVQLSQMNSKKSTVGSIKSSINSNTTTKAAPVTASNPSPGGDWPDSLKNYVNRCYEKCKTAVDKDQVEIILKGKITRAANDGSLWIKDWDIEPLPSIHSERMTMTIKAKSPIVKASNNSLTITMSNNLRRPGGLSTSLGARLGARLSSSGHRRSKSRTRSKSKSRSRSRSISPPSRKYRRSSSSSSSTSDRGGSHDYKSSSSSKSSKKTNNRNKDNHNVKKSKKNKQPKSHFYSEFGLATGNAEELGSKEKLQQRAARFHDSVSRTVVVKDDTADFDFTGLHIIGTCKDLEKPYLRLTSAPAPSAVRPVSVLQSSLAHVKKRWVSEQDYRYACDQLKSIRQDLTVQGIRDSFTVHVYETHARVALERGDHEEFNQCQTQLRMLYQDVGGDNRCEFVAYRILYYIFTKNTQDLTTILAALTKDDKKDECIKHALKVRSAWWLGNFHVFFKLYKTAPRMAAFLMDWFIARERKNALKTMIKSYRQNLAVDFIITELAFQSLDKFYEFVSDFGLNYADSERQLLDCKASSSSLGGW
ncbi:Similar to LENG8: Leukocyte receptor cluster member 8 (Homo sapiens) [Cotesia congregata]|uniref:Similar to LENG8: Leukocyte receptor cluster member 8 (Homo sapiens) n=1 Tax=Cotesia congregata TaxID=51543 RepID=A0A8J2HLJ0_COTCN|nr:Similar to LENG8: Leukocyte receptor cluster member 8 (Homo sapiens) [Cotesia congregata]